MKKPKYRSNININLLMKRHLKLISRATVILAFGLLVLSCSNEQTPDNTTPNIVENKRSEVVVYKSASCGCCGNWVKHMEQAGFHVTVNNQKNLNSIKDQYGVISHLQSCHTAIIDGYVFEGHIPADTIQRFIEEKPDAVGLAVPGMPIGSPGMEQGNQKDSYDIVIFKQNGENRVYERR